MTYSNASVVEYTNFGVSAKVTFLLVLGSMLLGALELIFASLAVKQYEMKEEMVPNMLQCHEDTINQFPPRRHELEF